MEFVRRGFRRWVLAKVCEVLHVSCSVELITQADSLLQKGKILNSMLIAGEGVRHTRPSSRQPYRGAIHGCDSHCLTNGANTYSGEFKLRIPPELHRELAIKAAEEKVSLNRLVNSRLVS